MADQTYICRDGDTLDWICWKYYGRQSAAVEAVLEVNPGLADRGPIYSAGQKILLPELPVATDTETTVRLWD